MKKKPTWNPGFGWQKFLSWLVYAVPMGTLIAISALLIPSPLKDIIIGVLAVPAFIIAMTGLLMADVGQVRHSYQVQDGEETKEIWSPYSARQLELARLNRSHQEAHPHHRQYASAILATKSGFKVVMVEYLSRGHEWPILWRIYTPQVLNQYTQRFSADEETKAKVMRDSLNQEARRLEIAEIETHYPLRKSQSDAKRQAEREAWDRERELVGRAKALNAC